MSFGLLGDLSLNPQASGYSTAGKDAVTPAIDNK